jgi:hypothetical protein
VPSGCPPNAPQLNPVEYLWANLKGVELANCTGDTIAQVADQAHHGAQRACDSDAWSSGSLPHRSIPQTSINTMNSPDTDR